MKRIIRRHVVESKTGLKHTEIYERIKRSTFPRQVRLGPKCVGWLEEEIDAWIDQRVAERDEGSRRSSPASRPTSGTTRRNPIRPSRSS